MLEGGLQVSNDSGRASATRLADIWRGKLVRMWSSRGSVASRMIQFEPQTPQDVLGAVRIHHTHALLSNVTVGVRSYDAEDLKSQRATPVLANHEEAAARVHLTEKRAGTKIAICDPQITASTVSKHRPEQRALLRMPIFTRKDIGDQAQGWLIDHERLPGKAARWPHAVL